MDHEKVIEKIKKLFALANCEGASENEAETAMRMANKLLDKHSLSNLDLTDNEKPVMRFTTGTNTIWIKSIYNGVSRLYDCKYFTSREDGVMTHVLVGTVANLTTARIVIDQLLDQVKKETRGMNAAFRNSAGSALYWKCDKILQARKEDKGEIIPGTGLVPLDLVKKAEVANADYIAEHVGELGKPKKRRTEFSAEGKAYGNRLNPGARVSGKGQGLLG